MSASHFPGFVLKEKGLLCQTVNYQLLVPANETDVNIFQTSEKNRDKNCTAAVQTLPCLPYILCLPVPGEAVSMQSRSPGAHRYSWGQPGVLPTLAVSSLKGRRRSDCHPAGALHSLHRESPPCFFSLVNPGKAFIEQNKPLALELLEPVFPRLGTTCLGYL